MLVPSPAFRSMALGIMVSVLFVLAASLTLLPAVLASSDRGSTGSRSRGRTAASTARRASPAGPSALAPAAPLRRPGPGGPARAGTPDHRPPDRHAVDQGRPARRQLAQSATARSAPRSAPARPARCRSSSRCRRPRCTAAWAGPGLAAVMPAQPAASGSALSQAVPKAEPVDPAVGATIDRLRTSLPEAALVGGAGGREPRPGSRPRRQAPLVIGVVLALGFLLLLVALQAPIIAAASACSPTCSATGAAFGVARLVFQDGHLRVAARLRVAGLPRRLGPRLLLRDDLRDLDGLHGLPAGLGQGALGQTRVTPGRRWSAASPTPAE